MRAGSGKWPEYRERNDPYGGEFSVLSGYGPPDAAIPGDASFPAAAAVRGELLGCWGIWRVLKRRGKAVFCGGISARPSVEG